MTLLQTTLPKCHIYHKQAKVNMDSITDNFKANHIYPTSTHSCQSQFCFPVLWVSVLCNLLWQVLLDVGMSCDEDGMSSVLFARLSHKSPPHRWTHQRSNRSHEDVWNIFFKKEEDRSTLHSHRLSKPGSTFHPQASFDWNLSTVQWQTCFKRLELFLATLGWCLRDWGLASTEAAIFGAAPAIPLHCYTATLLHCYTATLLLCCTATLLNPGAAAAVSSELENVKPMFGRCVRLSDYNLKIWKHSQQSRSQSQEFKRCPTAFVIQLSNLTYLYIHSQSVDIWGWGVSWKRGCYWQFGTIDTRSLYSTGYRMANCAFFHSRAVSVERHNVISSSIATGMCPPPHCLSFFAFLLRHIKILT